MLGLGRELDKRVGVRPQPQVLTKLRRRVLVHGAEVSLGIHMAGDELAHFWREACEQSGIWEFPKIRGTLIRGSYNKDPTNLGYYIRVPLSPETPILTPERIVLGSRTQAPNPEAPNLKPFTLHRPYLYLHTLKLGILESFDPTNPSHTPRTYQTWHLKCYNSENSAGQTQNPDTSLGRRATRHPSSPYMDRSEDAS